jgi:hypothetical protein
MKLAPWKRAVLAAVLMLGVVAPSVATVTAAHAADGELCSHPPAGSGIRPTCGVR